MHWQIGFSRVLEYGCCGAVGSGVSDQGAAGYN